MYKLLTILTLVLVVPVSSFAKGQDMSLSKKHSSKQHSVKKVKAIKLVSISKSGSSKKIFHKFE